jgi:hypothetical protein
VRQFAFGNAGYGLFVLWRWSTGILSPMHSFLDDTVSPRIITTFQCDCYYFVRHQDAC